MGQFIKSLASFCLSVCLSVRAPTVAIFNRFWWNFAQRLRGRKVNFDWCEKTTTSSPILPHFTPVMYFQWEGSNAAVTRPVDRLWLLRAQTACLVSTELQSAVIPNFAQLEYFCAQLLHSSTLVHTQPNCQLSMQQLSTKVFKLSFKYSHL